MTTAEMARGLQRPFERLFDALFDAARCERAMLLLLAGYAVAWTLYGEIVGSPQGLHADMTEVIAWSRDLSFGYIKHPPLTAWVVRLWFGVFPLAEWSYYLLAMLMPTVALWITWRLSADYLDLEKRVIGVALLMVVPFYNFHALKFNANTVQLPAWAATTLWFLRAYKSRSTLYSVLAGIGAAGCMLGKYWSIFLLAGLVLAALIDPRRRDYFCSRAPWVTIATGLVLFSPNLIWIYQHDFVPFTYVVARHGASFAAVTLKVLSYATGTAAYVVAPTILIFALAWPGRTSLTDMAWPADRERRLVATAFWAPLFLPVLGALASDISLTSLWSMPAFTLLPVMLLSSPAIVVGPINRHRILALAVALPIVMLLAAPAIALVIHIAGPQAPAAHGSLLAAETERLWHDVTPQPLRFVGCDAADAVLAYAPERPHSLPLRSNGGSVGDVTFAEEYWPRTSPNEPTSNDVELTKSGMALVCTDDARWQRAAAARAAQNSASRQFDVVLARSFFGIPGQPQHYKIFIIPPKL